MQGSWVLPSRQLEMGGSFVGVGWWDNAAMCNVPKMMTSLPCDVITLGRLFVMSLPCCGRGSPTSKLAGTGGSLSIEDVTMEP